MQNNKHFLLVDSEGNNIAVISKKGKASPSEFNKAIELAVKEHFSAKSATIDQVENEIDCRILRIEDNMTFSVATIEEGYTENEECIRDFTLEEIAVY